MAPGRPLGVGVDVHLHHACLDGVADVLQGGAGAAVEDEGHRLVAVAAQLLLTRRSIEVLIDEACNQEQWASTIQDLPSYWNHFLMFNRKLRCKPYAVQKGLDRSKRRKILDVLLGVVQDHRLQAHVARGIDAVHVAEGSGHGEVAVGDGGQGLIDLPHLLEKSSWMKGL